MQQYIIISFKNEKGRNTVIRYMEKYFGSNGLTFAYSLKTDKAWERIMLKMPRDAGFTNTINKFDRQGICKYLAMDKPVDSLYQDKNGTIVEFAAQMARLLGSLFGSL